MKALEQKILKDGIVLDGDILKVGSFLNQQLDIELLMSIGQEINRLYSEEKVTKILTVEASGIAVAVAAAAAMHKNVIFAKKSKTANVSGPLYGAKVHSYTHGTDNYVTVPKDYITGEDRVLIVDDFLATGEAFLGLIDIVEQSGAKVVGCVSAIEKGFQSGGDEIRKKGYRVDSLAIIEKMEPGNIEFRK